MKVRLSDSNIFKFLLFLFIMWGNVIIGIKWIDPVLAVMNKVSRVTMISIIALIGLLIIKRSKGTHKNSLIRDYISLVVVVIVYLITGENTLVFTIGLIVAAKGVNFEETYLIYFKAQLLALLISVFTCYLGLSQNIVSYFSYGVGYSWGMHHANNLAFMVASLYFAFSYLFIRERRIVQFILAVVLIAIVWKITVCRTVCALIALYPIINLFVQLSRKTGSSKILKYLKQFVLVMAILSIVISVFYVQINGGLNYEGTFQSRFVFGYKLLHKYGVHLFGSQIEYIGTYEARKLGIETVLLDNAYLTLIINYGILATIIMVYILLRNMSKAYREKNFDMLTIMLIYVISGISENGMLTVIGNVSLLYFYCNTNSNYLVNKRNQRVPVPLQAQLFRGVAKKYERN